MRQAIEKTDAKAWELWEWAKNNLPYDHPVISKIEELLRYIYALKEEAKKRFP